VGRAPDPLDYITKKTACRCAPAGTPHPLWTKFLERATDPSGGLQGLLQRYMGYCCTGFTTEHVFVFAFGTGANACEVYLRDGKPGNTTLEAVEVEPPKLNKGETVVDAIERHRRRVRELRADLHRIESVPYPSSYAKQRMRAQIGQLAQRGAPSVSSLVEHDREIAWPTQSAQSKVYNVEKGAIAFHETTDTFALVAWLHRDALIASLDREIASEADDPAALTHEARQQREAEVMCDLLAVERDECALVWRAQSERMPVEHRADISPLALLGLRLITAPGAVPSPTSRNLPTTS
jgi:hypothetical protein